MSQLQLTEAPRLADWLEVEGWSEAATELRRLHGENEILLRIVSECYQVIGILASECGRFDDPEVQKILDNAGSFEILHEDVLPFSSIRKNEND